MSTFLEVLFSQFPLTDNSPENTTADLDVTHTLLFVCSWSNALTTTACNSVLYIYFKIFLGVCVVDSNYRDRAWFCKDKGEHPVPPTHF
jgi:hypothetical protein